MTTKMKGVTCKKGYWYAKMKGDQVNCGYENKEINTGLKTKKIKFNKIKDLLRGMWQKEIKTNKERR